MGLGCTGLEGPKRQHFCPYQSEGKLQVRLYGKMGENDNLHLLQAQQAFDYLFGGTRSWNSAENSAASASSQLFLVGNTTVKRSYEAVFQLISDRFTESVNA